MELSQWDLSAALTVIGWAVTAAITMTGWFINSRSNKKASTATEKRYEAQVTAFNNQLKAQQEIVSSLSANK